MPTLKAGTYRPKRALESEELSAIVVEMRAKGEKEARRVVQERREAEKLVYELRNKRR